MTTRLHRLLVPLLSLGTTAATGDSLPMFQHAFENIEPEPYRIVVFDDGSENESTQTLVEALIKVTRSSGDGDANLTVDVVDIENLTDEQRSTLDLSSIGRIASARAYFPESTGIEFPFWDGAFTNEFASSLIHSPSRREIIDRFAKGASAVWLLIESGNDDLDQEAQDILEEFQTFNVANHAASIAATPGEEPEPDTPWTVTFSVVSFNPADPDEEFFARMLLRGDTSLDGPKVVPIFGRGRMLPPIDGDALTESAILEAAEYLSSEVTAANLNIDMGRDLLFHCDWDELLRRIDLKNRRKPPPSRTPLNAPPTGTEPILQTVLLSSLGFVLFVVLVIGILRTGRRDRV